eukprot:5067616-Amphidinium_carterae.1
MSFKSNVTCPVHNLEKLAATSKVAIEILRVVGTSSKTSAHPTIQNIARFISLLTCMLQALIHVGGLRTLQVWAPQSCFTTVQRDVLQQALEFHPACCTSKAARGALMALAKGAQAK